MLYLGAILMVISLATNVAAQVGRPAVREAAAGGMSITARRSTRTT